MGKALVGVTAVLAVAAGAYADIHIVQQFNMNFSDTPQSGSANLTVGGSATLSGSGTYYSWDGWPNNVWRGVTISFNNATVGLSASPSPTYFTSDPDGNGKVSFETVTDTLKQGTLDDLYVNIKDGAGWNFALANLVLTGDIGGGRQVTVTLSTSGSVTSYTFDMTGASTGSYASGSFPSITYNISPYGTASAAYSATTTGTLWIQDFGSVALPNLTPSGSVTTGVTATGTMTLTELAGPYPKDVAVAIHADSPQISMGLSTSGSYYFNNYSGGTNPYYIINLNYSMSGNVNLNGTHYDLYDTLVDVIPEPMTLAVFGLGGAMFLLVRRRGR
mgnify:CR=1 FL=1